MCSRQSSSVLKSWTTRRTLSLMFFQSRMLAANQSRQSPTAPFTTSWMAGTTNIGTLAPTLFRMLSVPTPTSTFVSTSSLARRAVTCQASSTSTTRRRGACKRQAGKPPRTYSTLGRTRCTSRSRPGMLTKSFRRSTLLSQHTSLSCSASD